MKKYMIGLLVTNKYGVLNFNELGTAVLHHSLRAEDIILIR